MNFCDKLRSLIEERNITQKQVATDLNIAPSTMGGYVQGSSEPDFETLKTIANYFDVSTDYLLNVYEKKSEDVLEDELLRVFRAIEPEYKQIFIEQGKIFLKASIKNKQ